mmetsp:Transcript_104036/g.289861  ORF Transcript_104036/g.289861 Transcript_104036/m.289861 type:complete len:83 (+) Transcript_104036:293-541(+)
MNSVFFLPKLLQRPDPRNAEDDRCQEWRHQTLRWQSEAVGLLVDPFRGAVKVRQANDLMANGCQRRLATPNSRWLVMAMFGI